MTTANITNRKFKKDLAAFSVNAEFVLQHAQSLGDLSPINMSGSNFAALKEALITALTEIQDADTVALLSDLSTIS